MYINDDIIYTVRTQCVIVLLHLPSASCYWLWDVATSVRFSSIVFIITKPAKTHACMHVWGIYSMYRDYTIITNIHTL